MICIGIDVFEYFVVLFVKVLVWIFFIFDFWWNEFFWLDFLVFFLFLFVMLKCLVLILEIVFILFVYILIFFLVLFIGKILGYNFICFLLDFLNCLLDFIIGVLRNLF